MFYAGIFIIFESLFFPFHWNCDPMLASKFGNAIYFAFSRIIYVFGVLLILLSIFTGNC